MTRDEKRQALQMWIGSTGVAQAASEVQLADLDEALYAISELGLWPDGVDSVSRKQALLIWVLIERLRTQTLPDELKM